MTGTESPARGTADVGRSTWSTAELEYGEAFEYWRDAVCDRLVHLALRRHQTGPFSAAIEQYRALGEVRLSIVTSDPLRADRTPSMISRGQEEFLLANILLDGTARFRQDGRVACLRPGTLVFHDSSRPYTVDIQSPYRALAIQVPRTMLPNVPLSRATAVALDATGPGRLVSEFCVGLLEELRRDRRSESLVTHAVGLLEFALGLAGSSTTPDTDAALRQTVLNRIARDALDPEVSAESIAAACHISRRTLFRVLAVEGRPLSELVRRERLRRAQALLRAQPHLPVAVVASRCGFRGAAQFHRVFRDAVGTSPGAYRSQV